MSIWASSLVSIDVQVWMLTGDKIETAVNIAVATSLLTSSMLRSNYVFEDLGSSRSRVLKKLQHDLRAVAAERRAAREQAKEGKEVEQKERALLIDGDCLNILLEAEVSRRFAALCTSCAAVICSRVTPYQKVSPRAILNSMPSAPSSQLPSLTAAGYIKAQAARQTSSNTMYSCIALNPNPEELYRIFLAAWGSVAGGCRCFVLIVVVGCWQLAGNR